MDVSRQRAMPMIVSALSFLAAESWMKSVCRLSRLNYLLIHSSVLLSGKRSRSSKPKHRPKKKNLCVAGEGDSSLTIIEQNGRDMISVAPHLTPNVVIRLSDRSLRSKH